MVTDRFIQADDYDALVGSLEKDVYHQGTTPEFFVQPSTVCKVYEDEKGPILFLRGAKALRLDIQFRDNNDHKRNMKAMVAGFPLLAEQAKANGFSEIIFNSTSPTLVAFCKRRFGFEESEGELRKLL